MKRILCSVIALIMLLSIVPCFAESDITIKLFRSGQGMPAADEDVILPGIKEALGCDVEWVVVSAEYQTQLGARLAGGDIPDLFQMDYIMAPIYAQQGLLLDLEPYLDQMPNFVAGYSEEALKNCYIGDGMYMIAARPYTAYAQYSIRQDWLDNLGLSTPTTLDELYDVMYAFTYNDPDGNGKDDTYGMTGQGLAAFNIIFNAYGTTAPGTFLVEDNQVVYTSVDPDAKAAIEFIQKLINDGIVDPEIMSNQAMEHRDKAIAGTAGILACSFWDIFKEAYMTQALEICPTAKWELLSGVEGPGGRYDTAYDATNAPSYFGINADLAEEPEKLAKVLELINFLCDNETGHRLTLFGQQGVHYDLDAEGNIVPLDALSTLTYSFNYTICGRDDLPYLRAKFGYLDAQIDQLGEMVTLPSYNSKVSVPENVIVSDIENYATTEITRFIYGERDLAEWDSYVDTLMNVYALNVYLDSAAADLQNAGVIK